jgi:hypothetical protein
MAMDKMEFQKGLSMQDSRIAAAASCCRRSFAPSTPSWAAWFLIGSGSGAASGEKTMHPKIISTLLAAATVLASTLGLSACGHTESAPAESPLAGGAPPAAPVSPPPAAAPVPARASPPSPPPPARASPSPSPLTRSASGCASADLAPFPWPDPPQPSVTAVVPLHLLFGPGARATTLADVAARLEGAIGRAGYLQSNYLGAGCDGFAIVLDLERIAADGTRNGGTAGFAPPGQDEGFSLTGYIRRLFYAPPGHYRQIVFVVSDQRMARTAAPATEAQLRAIARDGTSSLPAGFASVAYTPRHVVLVLIYEFEKGPRGGDANLVPPDGRLGATVHLRKARLF